MSQAAQPLQGAIHLTTYLELERIVRAFARGHLQLLILIGSHGLGKSRTIRQALTGQACWLEGHLSVFGLYCACGGIAIAPSCSMTSTAGTPSATASAS